MHKIQTAKYPSVIPFKLVGKNGFITTCESAKGKAAIINIKNGVVATSISFLSDATSGIISSNLSLPKMEKSLSGKRSRSKIYSIDVTGKNERMIKTDYNASGPCWSE